GTVRSSSPRRQMHARAALGIIPPARYHLILRLSSAEKLTRSRGASLATRAYVARELRHIILRGFRFFYNNACLTAVNCRICDRLRPKSTGTRRFLQSHGRLARQLTSSAIPGEGMCEAHPFPYSRFASLEHSTNF